MTRSQETTASRGPWNVGKELDARTFDAEASRVLLVELGGHTDIAYVAYLATDGDTAEQHANARLIAAAPELLALLREAETLAVLGDIEEDTEAHGWGEWLKNTRAILTKVVRP